MRNNCLNRKRDNMNCDISREDLILYAEGILRDERKNNLEAHMKLCPECREFINYLERSLLTIESEKAARPNPFLATRILSAMEEKDKSGYVIRRWIPAMAFSILLVAAVIGGINLGRFYSRTVMPDRSDLQEEMSYIDDIQQEQIETFFMTPNNNGNE